MWETGNIIGILQTILKENLRPFGITWIVPVFVKCIIYHNSRQEAPAAEAAAMEEVAEAMEEAAEVIEAVFFVGKN